MIKEPEGVKLGSFERVAAFFDMDLTLVRVNSGREWMDYLRGRGELGHLAWARALAWYAQYKLAILDLETIGGKLVAEMAGQSERELADKSRRFYGERMRPHISDQGRQALAEHRARGHEIVLLTSATRYVAEPLAEELGIEHVLCTRLGVRDGRFDGTIEPPACYGAGKVHHAARFCAARGLDLEGSWFYTDSFSDLPMLERVAGARVVNPDTRLRRHAAKVGWEPLSW